MNKHELNKIVGLCDYLDHKQKVIDRLSRKIQKKNKEINQNRIAIDTYKRVIAFKENYNFDLVNRLFKAHNYIEKELSWAVGSEELIKILEGKDEQ